jgi:HSP20 family protein
MAIIRWREPDFFEGQPDFRRSVNMLQERMNRLFGDFFDPGFTPSRSGVFPPLNLYSDDENLYITAELPGVSSDDIEIEAEAESANIKGERKIASEGDNCCYHRREREAGKFSRKIAFPVRIDPDKVGAQMKDGVLTLTLPKAADTRPKKIDVKLG